MIWNEQKNISEPMQYKEVNLINTIDANFYCSKTDLSLKEFGLSIENFVKKGEVINM